MNVPQIEVGTFESIQNQPKFLKNEKMFFASIDFTNNLSGKVIISLNDNRMEHLFRAIVGNMPMLSDIGKSCILEIGNLISASITNTISRALDIQSYIKAPTFDYKTYKDFFTSLFKEHKKENEYIWIIDADIIMDDKVEKGKVFIFPYDESFKKMGHAVLEKKNQFLLVGNSKKEFQLV